MRKDYSLDLIVAKCCMCDKIKLQNQVWYMPNQQQKEFYDTFATYSHTYCPEHLKQQQNNKIDSYNKR